MILKMRRRRKVTREFAADFTDISNPLFACSSPSSFLFSAIVDVSFDYVLDNRRNKLVIVTGYSLDDEIHGMGDGKNDPWNYVLDSML